MLRLKNPNRAADVPRRRSLVTRALGPRSGGRKSLGSRGNEPLVKDLGLHQLRLLSHRPHSRVVARAHLPRHPGTGPVHPQQRHRPTVLAAIGLPEPQSVDGSMVCAAIHRADGLTVAKSINAIAVGLPSPLSATTILVPTPRRRCARAHANLPTPQRNCPTSSRRRLCEQVFVLAQELR